jgi:universal stress protein A
MKIKPTSKPGGVVVELGPQERQIPAQTLSPSPLFNFKKILVPLDFSECSQKALQYATALARQFGAELELLHVVEPYPAVPEMYPIDVETVQDGKAELENLRGAIGRDVGSRISVRVGTPHLQIAEAARDLKADLIVISTHGRKGLSRAVLGSTTEKVVRHAPCPVLVVRETQTGATAQALQSSVQECATACP